MQITNKLLETNIYSLKNREIEQLVQFYTDSYRKVDNHPDKKDLINNDYMDKEIDRQREDVLNELLYYQAFIEAYNNARDIESSRNFYIELKNLNKNFFSHYINIDECISEPIPQPNFYNDNNDSLAQIKAELSRNEKEVKVKQPIIEKKFYYDDVDNYKIETERKEIKPVIDPYEEKRRLMEKERMEKIINENNKLAQSLNALEQQKQRLEEKVRDLEFQPNKSQLKTSHLRTNSALNKDYHTEGFQQVLRTKEEQIQTLQMKINVLEKEHQKLAEKDLAEEPTSYRTTIMNKSRMRSRVNNSHYKTIDKITVPGHYGGGRYHTTGSEFVDLMYNDINKLLNRSSYRADERRRSYVY